MTEKDKTEQKEKILLGLELSYQRMLEFKKQKNSELIVMQQGKIVRIKP